MRIRGVVQHSFEGSASRDPGEPWWLSLALRPWRDDRGALVRRTAVIWARADTLEQVDAWRASAPAIGVVIEVDVDASAGARLEGPERTVLVHWTAASDDELVACAASSAPPAELADPVLGTFTFDETLMQYSCLRRIGSLDCEYELRITPLEPTEPWEGVEGVRTEVAWLEANAAAIRDRVASELWRTSSQAWRQPGEELDERGFAAALRVSGAAFDAEAAPAQFRIYLDDDGLFGGHSIEVEIEDRQVVSTMLIG